jgi:transcription termination factor NusB
VQSSSSSKAPAEEFEGIPLIPPLISRRQQSEQYPPDIAILSGNLPAANKLAKSYFQQVATTINKNQDHLAAGIKTQLEEYAKLAALLETRRNELDSRLAKMLSQFRAFDSEVKTTVELLTAEIEKAEKLAEEIDPTIPKFADFGRQPGP